MTTRRIFGLILMPAGVVLIAGSACPLLIAIADYFAVTAAWGVTCPSDFTRNALLLGGVVIAVTGQRLYSGRNLRTGEKPEKEE